MTTREQQWPPLRVRHLQPVELSVVAGGRTRSLKTSTVHAGLDACSIVVGGTPSVSLEHGPYYAYQATMRRKRSALEPPRTKCGLRPPPLWQRQLLLT